MPDIKQLAYDCAMEIVHGDFMDKSRPLPTVASVAAVIEPFLLKAQKVPELVHEQK